MMSGGHEVDIEGGGGGLTSNNALEQPFKHSNDGLDPRCLCG